MIWRYTSTSAKCYSLVWMKSGDVIYRFYCLEPGLDRAVHDRERKAWLLPDYSSLYNRVVETVARAADPETHIYYQVLPLARIPEKGRGSASDVEIGKWLWADLDYKEVVDRAEFEGCRELEDHALVCYYREGDTVVKVVRPSLSTVLKALKNVGVCLECCF